MGEVGNCANADVEGRRLFAAGLRYLWFWLQGHAFDVVAVGLGVECLREIHVRDGCKSAAFETRPRLLVFLFLWALDYDGVFIVRIGRVFALREAGAPGAISLLPAAAD